MDAKTVKTLPPINRPYDWTNIIFLLTTPVVAFTGTIWYVWNHGVTWLEIANFFVMYLLTGLSITAGYHRFFAHRTYECSKPLQLFYLVFGAAAAENTVLRWSSDHRYHHRFVDTEDDPYNIMRGGLWAHIGWIFFKNTRPPATRFNNSPDLLKDPLVMWQHRWYIPLLILMSFALPAWVGLVEGRPVGGLLWGGFLRIVVVQHMTFFINSLAHLYGTRPYAVDNSARDNWWLGPFTFGEGYHNFHHKFQADYRNGVRWYQFDLAKWWLWAMRSTGQAWRLTATPEPLILKAKLEVEMLTVGRRLQEAGASEKLWERVQARLETGKKDLHEAMHRYQVAKLEYRRRKDEWSAEMRAQWADKLVSYRSEFDEARRRWKGLVQSLNRFPRQAQGLASAAVVLDVLKNYR